MTHTKWTPTKHTVLSGGGGSQKWLQSQIYETFIATMLCTIMIADIYSDIKSIRIAFMRTIQKL